MSGRCISRSLRVRVAPTGIRPQTHTTFHSPRRSSTLSGPNSTSLFAFNHSSSSAHSDYHLQLRLSNLQHALDSQASPSQLWLAYSGLISVANGEVIPLEIHQQVLRRCWPSTSSLRQHVVRGLGEGILPEIMDFPEERFHTVLRNIRSMGLQPTLDDLNIILEKFAVIGHYQGCWRIYKDLKKNGRAPSQLTFGFCIQSIAHRFSLPIPKSSRLAMTVISQDMFSSYLADMRSLQIPMTPVTFDLSIRILKETMNREDLENLMKWGYGLDLSNPDRLALEFSNTSHVDRLVPFPFTTTALNTLIDMLGRLGDIPKMIEAFEVLTEPLPHANEHFFTSFESDESDDYGVKVATDQPQIPLPHAKPNTTTYNMILRHVCQADHAVFARHYLNQARMLDRQAAHSLRNEVMRKRSQQRSLEEIQSPRISVNVQMLVPLLGQGNKDKNLGHLKWLQSKMPFFLRKCKNDLQFFRNVLQEIKNERLEALPEPELKKRVQIPVLELNVQDPPPPERTVVKHFNIDLHVAILSRNYSEMEEFDKRLKFIVGRTHERVKERLGRRIWSTKSVFFRHNSMRSTVSKEKWKDLVNFLPPDDSYPHRFKHKLRDRQKADVGYHHPHRVNAESP